MVDTAGDYQDEGAEGEEIHSEAAGSERQSIGGSASTGRDGRDKRTLGAPESPDLSEIPDTEKGSDGADASVKDQAVKEDLAGLKKTIRPSDIGSGNWFENLVIRGLHTYAAKVNAE